MNNITYLGIGLAVVAIIFAILWRMGAIARFTAYVQETKEELKKCTWPSMAELKGSTVVVFVATTMMSLFTVGMDLLFSVFIRQLL